MIGKSVTIVRVKHSIGFLTNRPEQERFTIVGKVTSVQRDDTGTVTGVSVCGTRTETGEQRNASYAVGAYPPDGSPLAELSAVVNDCGHDIVRCACGTA